MSAGGVPLLFSQIYDAAKMASEIDTALALHY